MFSKYPKYYRKHKEKSKVLVKVKNFNFITAANIDI